MSQAMMNIAALEPLFKPWEEPNAHRVRGDKEGDPAKIIKHRRPTPVVIAQNLRQEVHDWRTASMRGRAIRHDICWTTGSTVATEAGCKRRGVRVSLLLLPAEAIETLIYLKEVRKIESLSRLVDEFGGVDSQVASLGITDEEDQWSRYAFKMATGSGKTKVMSLAMVWSYFHSLRESDSEMARHFVAIAPNLTVYERLREDFKPAEGGPDIFDSDPLIPAE